MKDPRVPQQDGILPTFPDPKDATSAPSGRKLCLGLQSEEAILKSLQRTGHKLHGYEELMVNTPSQAPSDILRDQR